MKNKGLFQVSHTETEKYGLRCQSIKQESYMFKGFYTLFIITMVTLLTGILVSTLDFF
jgi:hypothetical protein